MKYLEIILKLAFVVAAIWIGVTKSAECLIALAVISILLGIVLIFNKKQSYGYELSKREVVMRRIEGILLVIFSAVIFYLLNA